MKRNGVVAWMGALLLLTGCGEPSHPCVLDQFDVQPHIDYCAAQAARTLASLEEPTLIPNSIDADTCTWRMASVGSWTCGFWPGQLWYLYEATGQESWREAAKRVTDLIVPVGYRRARNHDVGFILSTSVGNGYRLTGEPAYRDAMLAGADSLVQLVNPAAGTMLSWPNMVKRMGWSHNTIIDNMMNLELLFWAAAEGANEPLYQQAFRHAEVTMQHHFRPDGSAYHVAVYDAESGAFEKGVTHQGWQDETMWARGQGWAVYGFTLAYRFTQDERFLQTAMRAADCYLKRLPADWVPYWDFDAAEQLSEPQPRDASAAAITASALLELAGYVAEEADAERYFTAAVRTLQALSSADYQSREAKSSFLLHSTGHMPRGWEIDASISYADYYYLEALVRLQRLQRNEPVLGK